MWLIKIVILRNHEASNVQITMQRNQSSHSFPYSPPPRSRTKAYQDSKQSQHRKRYTEFSCIAGTSPCSTKARMVFFAAIFDTPGERTTFLVFVLGMITSFDLLELAKRVQSILKGELDA